MTHTTSDELARLLSIVRLPSGVECDLLRIHTEHRSLAWAGGSADYQEVSQTTSGAVRVLDGGGQGLIKETELNEQNIQSLVDRALAIARSTPKDTHRTMNRSASVGEKEPPCDLSIFSKPTSVVLDELKTLEAGALKRSTKLKRVVRLHMGEDRERKLMVNSHGVRSTSESTGTSFLVEVLAEEGGVTEVAWDGVARRFGADIDSRALVEQAVDTAVASLGGKPMSTGLYTVLIHPRVGTQLLSLLAQALSAEAVQNGRSFLKDRLGERVASPCVTLVDDSRRERGLSSLAYDDEGTAALPMNMIENGTLKNYFYDIRTAHRAGIKSNGRGFRSSPASAPSPQPTNFSIAAGTSTLAELTSAEKTVFLLHDIMGLHMAEPVTGEFSLGAAGFLYTNGKFARPVRGMTMAGTVGGLLQSIVAVGNDVHWASSFGAPYLLANGITLSGN